ncbi:MAG: metal ABC transporter permease [Rhodospirillaceae bacterium]|nr:metal ABC transporter permease [Rhodospirillaceae bacterium]|tara:strand:- start:2728 stop:4551 length:1824 start_codon:yes stop_codon:yes gene_type:complete
MALPDSTAPPSDRKAFRLFLPFLWPKDDPGIKLRLGFTIFFLFSVAGLNSVLPLLFASAIDSYSGKTDSGSPVFLITTSVVGLLFVYGFVHWFSRALNEVRWAIYGRIEQRIRRRVGMVVFKHLHNLSLRYHLQKRTGSLSRIMENGIRAIEDLLFDCIFLVLPFVVEIVLVVVVMLIFLDGIFALLLFATLILYLTALFVGSEWLRKYQRRAIRVGTEAHGKAVDSIINYETIKYSGNEDYVAARYDRALSEEEELTVRSLTLRSLTGFVQVSILGFGIISIVVTAGGRVVEGVMTIGALVAVNQYLLQLIRPLDRLGFVYRNIKKALVDLEQMLSLLEEQPEITDSPTAQTLTDGPGAIRFDKVSFAYDSRRPVLKNVSFEVPAGNTIALVGPSGAGKSTIGRLLFRFFDVTDGTISIDAQNIADLTQDSLHSAIAVVPQDTVLFNESLFYNIAFGRPDSSAEEVINAAKLAQIHDFIEMLPDGYNSLVGERGLKLSGGEKQRIAIARAALKNPRIFLFDEATSSLDSETETAIQQNLSAISASTTTIMIAHRLSTVTHSDEILFIEDGEVVERGNHETLLAHQGRYAELWWRQQEDPDADLAIA